MKILIVSDSHGLTDELKQIREKHSQDINLMVHCGDSELSADHPALENFSVVKGNCDVEETFPEDLVEDADGLRIFVTHGHRYSVKTSLMNLSYRARELSADIVCFGHSHFLGAEVIDNTLFINPGSIRLPRGRAEKTYVIIETGKDEVVLHVYDYTQGELMDLTQKFSLHK